VTVIARTQACDPSATKLVPAVMERIPRTARSRRGKRLPPCPPRP